MSLLQTLPCAPGSTTGDLLHSLLGWYVFPLLPLLSSRQLFTSTYMHTTCIHILHVCIVHHNAPVACQTVNESRPTNFSPVISRKLFFSSEMQCYVLQVESCAQSSSAAEGVLAAADSALATARAAMR